MFKKLGWLTLIWAISVLALFVASLFLKMLMSLAGLHV